MTAPHVYPRGTKAKRNERALQVTNAEREERALQIWLLLLLVTPLAACALSAALTRAAIP